MSTTKVSIPGEVYAQDGVRLTTPSTGPVIISGSGDPNGPPLVAATNGSLYLNTGTAQLWQYNGVAWVQPGSTPSFSGVSAYANGPLGSFTSGTWNVLGYDEENFDTDSYHSKTVNNSRFYAPSDGYYSVSATVEFITFNFSAQGVGLGVNQGGVLVAPLNAVFYAAAVQQVSAVVYLAKTTNDYVEAFAYVNGGNTPKANLFTMYRVG